MNKFLLITLGLAASLSAFAQGVFNASNNYPPTGKLFVLDVTGVPLPTGVGRVTLQNAANNAVLNYQKDATTVAPADGIALSLPGVFFINGVVVDGVAAGGTAQIRVLAWDSSTGATYAEAVNKTAGLITIGPLGGGTAPPATFAANSNWAGLTLINTGPVIPEPSTVALAALGVAGLFFVARRKS